MIKLCYVCTNFNNSKFTLNAIDSLNSINNRNVIVVIVDNCSELAEYDMLIDAFRDSENVSVIRPDTNLGYFSGLNYGLDYARKNFPEFSWYVIGNNDLVFPQDFYQRVDEWSSRLSGYSVISPRIITLDGQDQNPHVIEKIGAIRELMYDLYHLNYFLAQILGYFADLTRSFTARGDEREHMTSRFIYQGHGSCYVLSPEFFRHFNTLWAPSFLMGEEYFLSNQLSSKNIKVYYCSGIEVIHACNASISKLPKYRVWLHARNAHKIYRLHVRGWLPSRFFN